MSDLKRLNIEINSHCNYNCVGCPNSDGRLKRGKGHISDSLFEKISRSIREPVEKIYLWNYGEPLLHPNIKHLLREIQNCPAKTILSTNGSKLKEFNDLNFLLNLDELIVSLNGMDKETYTYHHKNGNLEKVKEGIKRTAKATNNEDTNLTLQMVVNKKNKSQIDSFIKYAKVTGADKIILKSFNVMDGKESTREKFVPASEDYRRNKSKNPPDPLPCTESMVINYDGSVNPCCWDYSGKYILGNVKKKRVYGVWNSEKAKRFRKNIKKNKLDICSDCSLETIIREEKL